MARVWDVKLAPSHERGVSHGVLYFSDGEVLPWVGLINVGALPESDVLGLYFEGEHVGNTRTYEEFAAEVECFTYPPDILEKPIKAFSFRSKMGDGFKIHLIYNPVMHLSTKTYSTLADDPEVSTFSFEVNTVPEKIEGYAPSSYLFMESNQNDNSGAFDAILGRLYGTDTADPELLSPGLILASSYDPLYLDILIEVLGGVISWEGESVELLQDGVFSVDHSRVQPYGPDLFTSEVL